LVDGPMVGYPIRGLRPFLGASFRALFLLNLWNDKTLQGPGFAWVLEAWPGAKSEKLLRHASGFNTTPALAPLIAGAVARMESEGVPERTVLRTRDAGATSLAALGDALFWGAVTPAAVFAGLVLLSQGAGAAAAVLVAGQWLPQMIFRVKGLGTGLRMGAAGLATYLRSARAALEWARVAAATVAGAFAAAVVAGSHESYGVAGALAAAAAVPSLGWLMSSRGVSPQALCVAALVLSGALSRLLGR